VFVTPSFTAGYEGHMMDLAGTAIARADAGGPRRTVMFSNRLTFGVLAVACIVAAGAGGYFATRQNVVPAPVGAVASDPATPATATPGGATVDSPVQETEAVVGETAPNS